MAGKQKCPDLVIVPPNFDEYLKYSRLVREVYYQYTDLIEPLVWMNAGLM